MTRPSWLRRGVVAAVAILVMVALAFIVVRRLGGDDDASSQDGAPAAVVLAPARSASVARTIEAVADVEAAESVIITAETAGRVAGVEFVDGQQVRAGDVLFRLKSDQEAADAAAAGANATELRTRLARVERLGAEGIVARADVDDLRSQLQAADARAESLRTLLRETVIRAPFDGAVGLREASPGAVLQPGDELVSLDDTRSVKLRFTLPEQQFARVRAGAPVEARSPAFPERVFRGAVTGFDSRLDRGRRTLELQALLPNDEGLWRAGMLANVRILAETMPQAVTVPPMAVQVRGDVQFLFRVLDGCAQRVEVEVGQREPERLEIVRGLRAGDAVVVEGYQDLSTGQPVIEAPREDRPRSGEGRPARDQDQTSQQDDDANEEKEEPSDEEKEQAQAAHRREMERCQALVARADAEQARNAEDGRESASRTAPGATAAPDRDAAPAEGVPTQAAPTGDPPTADAPTAAPSAGTKRPSR